MATTPASTSASATSAASKKTASKPTGKKRRGSPAGKKKGRRTFTDEQKARHLAALDKSGLSPEAYAKRAKLTSGSVRLWRSQAAEAEAKSRATAARKAKRLRARAADDEGALEQSLPLVAGNGEGRRRGGGESEVPQAGQNELDRLQRENDSLWTIVDQLSGIVRGRRSV